MKKLVLWVMMFACASTAYAIKGDILKVGNSTLKISAAVDDGTRQAGWMFQEQIDPNEGMLFAFPGDQKYCMWMKNTKIPLSVAFIDAKGKVINIEDMTPMSETTHCATAPARYALEVGQGWFKKHGVRPGTRIPGVLKYAPIN